MTASNQVSNSSQAAKISAHILGYPRIGDKRQTKFALEYYWQGKNDYSSGIAHYDLVLSQAVAFGVQPPLLQLRNMVEMTHIVRQKYATAA